MSGRGVGVVGVLFARRSTRRQRHGKRAGRRTKPAVRLYRWRRSPQTVGVLAALAAGILAIPLLVLATGLVAYPVAFLVQMVDVDAGHRIATGYAALIARAFGPAALPTVIPRLVTFVLALAVVVLIAAAPRPARRGRQQVGHRTRGFWWGRLAGSPWSAAPALRHYHAALWQLFKGPAHAKAPKASDLSRRYVELLAENIGQPGFREVIVATLDLETRTDLIFAAIGEARRHGYLHRGGQESSGSFGPERPGDLIDLAGVGRNQVLDALAGALSLPVLTEPHMVAFSPESYWKGETHRTCDRPAAVGRLLHELATAGVEQVIVVSASAEQATPHRLNRPSGTLRARVAEHLVAAEAAAVRDAVAVHASRFKGVFLIQPEHNPVGPFDFDGAYDERSDRFQSIEELIDRGYEDAYRQFIEPVVGEEGR